MTGKRKEPEQTDYEWVRDRLVESHKKDVEFVSAALRQRKPPPGMVEISEAEMVQYTRDHWGDINFRMKLLQRYGPARFLELAKQAAPSSQLPQMTQLPLPMDM